MADFEIVIEPDVVPLGTVDFRALTAPAGTPAPEVRVEPDGRVVRFDALPPVAVTPRVEVDEDAPTARPGELPVVSRAEVTPSPLDTAAATANLAAHVESLRGSPDLAGLDAAAEIPIPPRPASADEPSLVAVGAEFKSDEFHTDLDDAPTTFLQATKYISWLLILPLLLGGLWMYLNGMFPIGTQIASVSPPPALATTASPAPSGIPITAKTQDPVAKTEDPVAKTEEPVAKTGEPVAKTEEPVAKTEEPVAKTEEPVAKTEEPVAAKTEEPVAAKTEEPIATKTEEPIAAKADPDPEAELRALREQAGRAETGGALGIEEDEPGLLQRIRELRARAEAELDAGQPEEALAALMELIEALPEDGDARFLLGRTHEALGDPVAAEAAYVEAAKRSPEDPRPWNNIAVLKWEAGKTDEARVALQEGLTRAPGDPDVLSNLAGLDVGVRPAQAHALYSKALAESPTHEVARLGRAQVRERLGDVEGATGDYEHLVSRHAKLSADALDGLGRLSRRGGDPQMAVAFHQRALAAKDDPAFRRNLALAHIDANELQEARQQLMPLVAADPNDLAAWRSLGVIYARLGDETPSLLNEAKRAYERAIKLAPRDWRSRYNYAICAERFGQKDVATKQYRIAIGITTQAWPAVLNLARMLEGEEEHRRALAWVDESLKENAKVADLHLRRGSLLAHLERPIEAKNALRQFLELAEANDPRRAEIEALLPEHADEEGGRSN
ncbi:MAG: tetratricopeptide repeat protein [Planctomycetes bacterium]|nr:tetratricopeptide repeat protein [Planctomycetota bacterium]